MNTTQVTTVYRQPGRIGTLFQCSMLALAFITISPWHALAQDEHSHATTAQSGEMTPAAAERRKRPG